MDPTASVRDGHGPGDMARPLPVLLGAVGLRVVPGWDRGLSALGEQINTHCNSLDSCSAHGHRGITFRPVCPMCGQGHRWVGLGCSPMGKGGVGRSGAGTGRACQASTSRHGVRGHPSMPELAAHQGPDKVGSAGSTGRQGWTGARYTAAVGHWPCSPAVPTLPGEEKQGLPKVFRIFI